MTRDEFIASVKRHPLLREAAHRRTAEYKKALEGVIQRLVQHDRTQSQQDVRMCIEMADLITTAATPISESGSGEKPVSARYRRPTTPFGEEMGAKLQTGLIRTLRDAMFGTSKAPLRSLKAAARWIKKTAAAERHEPSDEERRRGEELVARIREQAEEASRVLGGYVSVSQASGKPLAFLDEDGKTINTIYVPLHSKLARLRYNARFLHNLTDYPVASIVAAILVDTPLMLPPWIARVTTKAMGAPLERIRGEVIFPSLRDVSEADLRAVFRTMREAAGLTKKKALTERDQVLLSIIREAGGVPKDGKVAFWNQVREQFRSRARGGWSCPTGYRGMHEWHRSVRRKLGNGEGGTA